MHPDLMHSEQIRKCIGQSVGEFYLNEWGSWLHGYGCPGIAAAKMDEFHGGTVPTLQVTDYVCGEVDQVMGKLKRGSGSDLYKLSIMLYVPRKLSIREVARRWKTGRTSIQEKKLQLERIVEICLEERGLVDVEIRVDKVAGQ